MGLTPNGVPVGALTLQGVTALVNAIMASQFKTTGNIYYCDPKNGIDNNNGQQATQGAINGQGPVKTPLAGYGLLVSGNNDVLVLISDGTTSSTARVDAAFTWSKNAAHLIGVSSGVNISNRSRIAPTGTTTAFANFFTVSGNGCLFSNIEWFHGFNTGTTAAICMTVTGGRNMFQGCHIAGMGDTASAQSSTSRSLLISGSTGENMFVNCTIGLDTQASNTTNASIELAGGTPRNQFINCLFPRYSSSTGTLIGVVAAASAIDRFTLFKNCTFLNGLKSGGATLSAAFTMAASAGGMLVMDPLCMLVGISAFGTDATSLAQIFVGGPAVNSGAGKSVASA